MDTYTAEERNNMIKKAMDNYKYKDLDLKIGDVFAIHGISQVFKIQKEKENLSILMATPEDLFYYDCMWSKVKNDSDLKYFTFLMNEYSFREKQRRYNFYYALKNLGEIEDIIMDTSRILKENNRMINIAVYYDVLDMLIFRCGNRKQIKAKADEVFGLRNIIEQLIKFGVGGK